MTPRWKKVLSDLWGNKVRTLLAALSIAIGVFAVGLVGGTYFILAKDVPADYLAANPHSAIIFVQPFDDDLLVTLRRTEGVADLEGRSAVFGQIQTRAGSMSAVSVTLINGIDQVQIGRPRLLEGSPELRSKEIYLERGAVATLGAAVGDTLTIDLGNGYSRDLRVAGIIHDVTKGSFEMSQQIVTYANPETIEWLGGTRQYSQIMFTVTERGSDEEHVRAVAARLSDKVKKSGREVFVTVVQNPGAHPAQQIVDTLLALLGGMGVLAVVLSTFLVINTISALLSQQVRQIGVMKAIGATMAQVMGMYLALILLFGLVALALAVPVSGALAYLLASGIALLLNINLAGLRIVPEAFAMQAVVGLVVPLLAGLVPVINGARLTVREAISNYGLSTGGSRSAFDALLESVRGLPRPLLLSLRNTFRRKARLALTLSTLILGGAIFIGVLNVRLGLYAALDKTFGYFLADVNVEFNRPYRMERIAGMVEDIPGLDRMEGWGFGTAQAMKADGVTGDEVIFVAPPASSNLIEPVLTAGRWLLPEDENAVVLGNHFMAVRPEVKIGDEIIFRINGKDVPFRVVGIYQMAGTVIPPMVYTNAEYLAQVQNEAGMVYSMRVVTDRKDAARQQEVARALEARFQQEGISVGQVLTGSEQINQQRFQLDILIYLLLVMAILIAFVGGLGLMGTMSMNVLERTREIGVMRSIGAVDGAILQLVLVEGMLIGVISWVLGGLVSVPITHGLNNLVGVSLLLVPLDYVVAPEGLGIWLVVVVALSALASLLPARSAVRLTVRDVLAYE
jgi:putative ABC transport system permease protein